jgi:hypothetical protein
MLGNNIHYELWPSLRGAGAKVLKFRLGIPVVGRAGGWSFYAHRKNLRDALCWRLHNRFRLDGGGKFHPPPGGEHRFPGRFVCFRGKGKISSSPYTGLDRPLGSRSLTLPQFLGTGHMKVARLSAVGTGRLYLPGTDFC